MRKTRTLDPFEKTVEMVCDKCDTSWDTDAPKYGVDFEEDDGYVVMTEDCPECGESCDLELDLEWKRNLL